MRPALVWAFLLLALPAAAAPSWWGRLEPRDLAGQAAPDRGRWTVVVFLTPDCPLANASVPELNRLAAEFTPKGVAWYAAYVDPTASLEALRAHAAQFGLALAALDDRRQQLAKAAGATYTPEVAVFSAEGTLLYRGRIDDRVGERGVARPAATQDDLRGVLLAVTAGATGPFPFRDGFGCALPEVPAGLDAPTWSRDIAPIVARRCVECHQPGEVAPFSLVTYADAAKRAKFVARLVRNRTMPPWLPDGPAGAFVGERRLSESEIDLVSRWAAGGAPEGDSAPAPPPQQRGDAGWRLGKPDLVVRMPRLFTVPAGPEDTYEVLPAPFTLASVPPDVIARARLPDSDVLGVAAVEIRPGNPRSLHHADVWVDTSGEARKRADASGGVGFASFGTPGFVPAGWLGGRVPGMTPRFLPHGIAASVLPLQGDLAFQIHYRATGKPEVDQTEVGIYFMREPVRRVMDTLLLRSFHLEIPAGDANYTVEDQLEVPVDCALLDVFPHMHLIARSVHAEAVLPDGQVRVLLDISRWDFRWQDRYFYHEPILLPKGTRVRARWVYDNSAANPANPFSPPRPIHFGPNATDEMCALQLGVIPMQVDDAAALAAARERKMKEKIEELPREERSKFRWDEALR